MVLGAVDAGKLKRQTNNAFIQDIGPYSPNSLFAVRYVGLSLIFIYWLHKSLVGKGMFEHTCLCTQWNKTVADIHTKFKMIPEVFYFTHKAFMPV
jgi:hypothetical protein